MPKRPEILNEIVLKAHDLKSRGESLVAVFDLDSTLFDVSPRITKILHTFAELPEIKTQYPEASAALSKIESHSGDFGVKRTLMRINFKPPNETFIKQLVEYWKTQFFSSRHLHLDPPYPGAVDFVRDLYNAGAKILYLTGRDIPRMLAGSVESLKTHGFPLDEKNANLFLKPSTEVSDSEFKKEFFQKLVRTSSEVWFFENEPTNIHLVMENSPHVKILFLATVHSGAAPEPGLHVPRVTGFIS